MENGYRRFRHRLLARRNLKWRLMTGSLFERPLQYIIEDPTDLDNLTWPSDLCAIPPGKPVPPQFRRGSRLLTVLTEGVHPGFARLLTDKKRFYRRPNFHSDYISTTGTFKLTVKGPTVKRWKTTFTRTVHGCDLKNFYELFERISELKPLIQDYVEAIICPYWPPEAEEWVTRERLQGWPTNEEVKKIVGRGCHFVAKPHQSNPNDATQWRFSFSQAEIILVSGWTDVQMYVYHVLRVIKSEVVKACGGEDSTVLCTFFFKTLMFWACEEKSREFWNEENLEDSVGELLCQMIEWLIERRCPNYFIPSNNMIDYLCDDVDLSTEISQLLYYRESCCRSIFQRIRRVYVGAVHEVLIPEKFRKIVQFNIIYAHLLNPLEPKMTDRLMEHLCNSNEILHELKYIYLGIASQSRLMNSTNENLMMMKKNNAMLLSMASKYFDKAVGYKYKGSAKITFSLCDTLPRVIEKLMSTDDHVFFDQSRPQKSKVDMNNTNKERNMIFLMLLEVIQCLIQQIDEKLPAPFYFVAAAYRANFLYSALRDYGSAERQCGEAIEMLDRHEDAIDDADIFKFLLRFIVTSEISVVFDEHIQVLLGFVALFRQINRQLNNNKMDSSMSERRVVFYLDAGEFLRYIRHRCSLHLGHKGTTYFKTYLTGELFPNKMFVQAETKNCSNVFLDTAIRISAIKPQ